MGSNAPLLEPETAEEEAYRLVDATAQDATAPPAVKDALLHPVMPPTLDIPEAFRTGWKLFTANWLSYIAFFFLVAGIVPALEAALYRLISDEPPTKHPMRHPQFYPSLSGLMSLVLYPLTVGPFITAAATLRDDPAGFRCAQLFHGFKFYLPLLAIILLQELLIILGLGLFVVPGIYAIVVLGFSSYVYIEYHQHNVGVLGSMQASWKRSHMVFWRLLLLMLALFGVELLGLLAFGIGIYVAAPVAALTYAAAFHQVIGVNPDYDGRVCCMC